MAATARGSGAKWSRRATLIDRMGEAGVRNRTPGHHKSQAYCFLCGQEHRCPLCFPEERCGGLVPIEEPLPVCEHCLTPFRPVSRAGVRRYCSDECRRLAALARRRVAVREVACRHCGTMFRPVSTTHLCCSRQCRDARARAA